MRSPPVGVNANSIRPLLNSRALIRPISTPPTSTGLLLSQRLCPGAAGK